MNANKTMYDYTSVLVKKCTCEGPLEFDDHHELDCGLVPALSDWSWYPCDGEIENGGVWVNPKDLSAIVVEVKDRYIVVKREADDEEGDGDPEKAAPPLQVA